MLGESNVCATIPVKDIGSAKEFYEKVLGLNVEKNQDYGVLYASGESKVLVYQSEYAGTNQATTATWNVEDLKAVVDDLKQKGVTFEHYENMPDITLEGDIHVGGGEKVVWFKDPDGNILCAGEKS